MAISNVTVVNNAFTMLSVDRIQAMNDTSEQARKAAAVFDDERDFLLSLHPWNFAIKDRRLSQLSETPALEGWDFAFQIPADCITPIRIDGLYSYKVVGNKIYCNVTNPVLEYVSRETDPMKWSKGFVKALSSRLAAVLAFGLTQNATLASNMDAIAQRDLKEAKDSDGQAGQGMRVIRGSLIRGT